jgi:Skp family chaperone for outer membrane proteins
MMKLRTAIALALLVATLPLAATQSIAQTAPRPAAPSGLPASSPPGTRLPSPLIGVVDAQRVLRESAAYRGIKEQMDKVVQSFQSELQKRSNDLRTAMQTLDQQRTTLSADAYSEKRMGLETQGNDLQKDAQNRRQQIDETANESQQQIGTALIEIMEQIRQERGLNLILLREAVPAMAPEFDLSGEALQRLDKKLPKVNVKLPALAASSAPQAPVKH